MQDISVTLLLIVAKSKSCFELAPFSTKRLTVSELARESQKRLAINLGPCLVY